MSTHNDDPPDFSISFAHLSITTWADGRTTIGYVLENDVVSHVIMKSSEREAFDVFMASLGFEIKKE